MPEGGGEARGSETENFINAKSSSTCYYPFVRVGIVKLWHDTVHARARRHKNRGVSKRLQVASISAHLVTTNAWVRRLRVGGKPIDKAAVTRIITKAVTLYNATNTIRQHNTGRSADYVEEKVNERVTAQSKSWQMGFGDASKILDLVTDTQPLVGGVQHVSPPFGGSPPDDGPDSTPGNAERPADAGRGSTGPAGSGRAGGSAGGDGRRDGGSGEVATGDSVVASVLADASPDAEDVDCDGPSVRPDGSRDSAASDSEGGSAGWSSPPSPPPGAGSAAGTSGAPTTPARGAGVTPSGASGRSRRAAIADAALEAAMPGGADLMRSLAASLGDGARRCDEKQKTKRLKAAEVERTKRVALLTAAMEKQPDNETFRDMLRAAMRDSEP